MAGAPCVEFESERSGSPRRAVPSRSMFSSRHDADNIERFLRFFKSKREIHLGHNAAEFDDVRSDRLQEDIVTRDEATEMLDQLQAKLRANVEDELKRTTNMTVLLLKQIMDQSEDAGVQLEMDFGVIEDQALLLEVEDMATAELVRNARRETRLVSIKDEQARILSENAALRERAEGLEQTCAAQRREIQGLGGRAGGAEAKLSAASAASASLGAEAKRLAGDLASAKGREAKLGSEAMAQDQRITQTRQFQQLKGMLAEKNKELVALRRRLQQYEADDCKLADDE